jgi:hypothetical protein
MLNTPTSSYLPKLSSSTALNRSAVFGSKRSTPILKYDRKSKQNSKDKLMQIVSDDVSGIGNGRTFSVKYKINIFEGSSRNKDFVSRDSVAKVERSYQSQDLSDCDALVAGKYDIRPIDILRKQNKSLREKVRYYKKSKDPYK